MQIKCDISEMHRIELELLNEFRRVCDKNGIPYYLACGTCLGAVRHKGFIPWDHDADVFIHGKDIDRLISLSSEFENPFFLQSIETDKEYNSIILRLRNSDTTFITTEAQGLNCNQGFAIDIYPLYNYPTNPIIAHIYILLSYLYRVLVAGRGPIKHGIILNVLARIILTCNRGDKRKKRAERIKRKLLAVKEGKYVLTYYGLDISFSSALLYETKWFKQPSSLLFEGSYFSGPTDFDAYLKKKYGDYMKIPSKEKQKAELSDIILVDPYHSYLEYINEDDKKIARGKR